MAFLLFQLKYQFINNLKMTDLIDINYTEEKSPDQMPHKYHESIKRLLFRKAGLRNSLKIIKSNYFSFISQGSQTPFNFLFNVTFSQHLTTIKIYILRKNGDFLKIQSTLTRIHMIKKFFSIDTPYSPYIDPLTGGVYFSISHFQGQNYQEPRQFGSVGSILLNLNLQKLYQSILKLSSLDYFNQQYSSTDSYFGQKKYFSQLSKIVSLLCDSDTIDGFFNQQKQKLQESIQSKKKLMIQDLHYIQGKKFYRTQANIKMLKKYTKSLEEQNQKLNSLIKRKNGKSNYQPLLVNLSSQKLFKQAMMDMLESNCSKKSLKVMQSQLGKVTINLQKQDQKVYKAKNKLLASLPKNTQYHFLDKYFKNDLNMPITMTLSLKQQSFPRFLEVNKLSMSLQTKVRILLQISSAIHTFWEQKKIILYLDNPKKIFITKTLAIKIRSLSQYFKVQPHMILEDKFMVNTKLIDNYLNLSQIYFKIFFNYNLIYVRPSKQRQLQLSSEFQRSQIMLKNLTISPILPQNYNDPMKDLVTGLNYIFTSFVNKAIRLAHEQKILRQSKKQVFKISRALTEGKQQSDIFSQHSSQSQSESCNKVLNYKYTCSWLLKIFQMITQNSPLI